MSRVSRARQRAAVLFLASAMVLPALPLASPAPVAAADPNPIVTENALPGNPASEWDISGAGDPSIQGFATDISVDQGTTVEFKIDTVSTDYRVDIYRLGWYGGDGARKVATVQPSAALPQAQPGCLEIDGTTDDNLIDCGNWGVSASWAVPANAVSGIYIARPVREDVGGDLASHIVFIVRDDDGGSDLLFQTSDTTWQAYNGYGGYSLYANPGHAHKVSYNRPFSTRANPTEDWLFNAEYPMLRWLERNGYDVSYFTDVDSDRLGAEILEHQAFLSVGHDEYWSAGQRQNVEAARDAGVNLAFFSGNEIYWKTRWEASTADGGTTDHRTLVSFKEGDAQGSEHYDCAGNFDCDPHPTAWTGLWRQNAPGHDGGQPENALSGQISWGDATTAIQVPAADTALRFWRNTEMTGATTLTANTLGYEFDWEQPAYASSNPPGRITLSDTTATGKNHKMSLYRAPSGALVFGAGTVQWSWGIDDTHDRGTSTQDPRMQQATVNLLSDMGAQPATLKAGLDPGGPLDTTAPTATITDPAGGSTVAGGNVTISGTAADTGGIVAAVEVSTDGGTTWSRATGMTTWTHTFNAANGSVTALARAVDDAANIGTAASVTFTAAAQVCPCSIFTASTTGTQENDTSAVELGVKFRSDTAGFITGIRFYKTSGNTGTHTGRLWTTAGTSLGTVTFSGETATGWQEATFGAPIAIDADTTYVASYHTTSGYYAIGASFASAGVDSPPLHALQGGIDGPNGVYQYGAGGVYPTVTFGSSNYLVDVVFVDDVGPDTTPPTIVGRSPGPNATSVQPGANVTVTFNEPIDQTTIGGNVELRDAADAAVDATITYAAPTRTITIDPSASLAAGAIYSVHVLGGATGIADTIGNRLAADSTWSFTVAAAAVTRPDPNVGPGGPVLVVKGSSPFGSYLPEIMRGEGLNLFTVGTTGALTAGGLAPYATVVLGETTLTSGQVTALTDWVSAGGNLVALRPDSQLADLLGLTSAGGTLAEGYVDVDTGSSPGAGIVGETMQFHGTADRYTAQAGTQVVATLYSDATTATANPAVTLRTVGTQGGSAAAFTYDLARSIVLTRQGNPAWANVNGDGSSGPFRGDDLFHNGSDPDWVNLDKVAIPQADEQQRLLANILTETTRDALPLPRFWYLPRSEVAALVMTADEHNSGSVTTRMNDENAASATGCSVADWECIRSTSYLYPDYASMSAAQASAYEDQGFEIALHPNTGCINPTREGFESLLTTQLDALAATYPGVERSTTSRNHCIAWRDYTTIPEELANQGIHLDTNYYYWPDAWVQNRPGLFTGSGFAQRFATTGGDLIDVYQAATQMTDESGQSFPSTATTLMDRAINQGYYGTFVLNFHTDGAGNTHHGPVVAAAKARGVPVITAQQLLTWTDGRNASSFEDLAWSGNQLTFSIAVGAGANGLQAMLPVQGVGGTLQTLTRGATPIAFTTRTIKGVEYAVFPATAGDFSATYDIDSTAPTVVSTVPAAAATDVDAATPVSAAFSEAIDASTLNTSSFTLRADDATQDVAAAVSYASGVATLTPAAALAPETTYTATLGEGITDVAGNPLAAPYSWTFTTGAAQTTFTIFGDTPGVANTVDTGDYELGVKFRTSVNGVITGVRFYKPAGTTGQHVGKLWTRDGVLLASATFAETASGWQTVSFASPVAVTANTTFVASYSWPSGSYYPFQAGAFTGSGVTNGPLTALQTGVDGGNGVLNETPGLFPTMTFNAANYWADVVFDTQTDTTAPTITDRTPASGATDVAFGSSVAVTFSEPMAQASISASTVRLRAEGAGTDVPATVTYAANTATLNPTSDLAPSTTYSVTVAGSVTDLAGNSLGNAATWSFTTAAAPAFPCPCTIWAPAATPTTPAVTDNQPIEVGVKFRAETSGYITGIRFYKGTANTGTHVGHLWSAAGAQLAEATFSAETASGWQQVDFATPVLIDANTTYIASYHSPSGYFAIDANYFTSTGVNNPPLQALAAGVDGANGVFKYGASGFPTGGSTANYWVDVVFQQPETTAPTITGRAPAANGTGVGTNADVVVTFSEPIAPGSVTSNSVRLRAQGAGADVAASLNVSGAVVTLDPTADLAPNTTYTATVTTAVTDRFGNALGAISTWSFTTGGLTAGFIDTTVADFGLGATGANTYVSNSAGGEVTLAPTVGSEFDGTNLPSGWSSGPWTGGSAIVGGGGLTVDGAWARTSGLYDPGHVLEFRATFGNSTYHNAGLSVDFNDAPWAAFGIGGTSGQLYARISGAPDQALGASYLGSPHTYRIEWTTSEIRFYVDGVLVRTAAGVTGQMRPIVSDLNVGGASLAVDWIRMTPYASPGTFTSRVFDAGTSHDWTNLTSIAMLPTETSVAFETRTGASATPDGSWSTWEPVTGGTIASPNARYAQYRVTLASSDSARTPVVERVELTAESLPANRAPLADDQSVTTAEDTAKPVTLTATDADGDSLTFTVVGEPEHGVLSGTAPYLTYTPDGDYHGPDGLTFTAEDGSGASDIATVSITVTPANDAPTCADGDRSTTEDTLPTGTVSCLDADLDDLTVSLVTDVAHGVLDLAADGSFTYTPAADYHGPDSFTFSANDGTVDSNVATISIDVTPANDAPVLAPIGDQSVAEGATILVNLSAGDVDGDELTFDIDAGAPAWATLTDAGDGTASLAMSPGFADGGTHAITITVSDGTLDDAETFNVVVGATNRAPIADGQALTTAEDTELPISLTATDADNDPLTFTVVGSPAHGTLSGTAPDLTYTPDPNWNGEDSFTFTASDGDLTSAPATVSITVSPVNDAPVCFDAPRTTAEDTALMSATTCLDSDLDTLAYAVVDDPLHGVLSAVASDGSFTYTPAADYAGTDSFTFTASDGSATSNVATVSIDITPVNDAPSFDQDLGDRTDAEGDAITLDAGATDPEGDDLTYSAEGLPAGLSISPTSGLISGTIVPTAAGVHAVTVSVSDGIAAAVTDTFDWTVTNTNRAPIADGQSVTTAEDTELAISLTATDPDGESLTYTVVSQPDHGTLSGSAPDLTYAPDLDFHGPDSFTFTASDGSATSNTATIAIDVTPVNDFPSAGDDAYDAVEDTTLVVGAAQGVLADDGDVDGDSLTAVLVDDATEGTLVLAADGSFSYTPDAGFGGIDTFTYRASDGSLASTIATVTITVTAVDDAPACLDGTRTTAEDTVLADSVACTDGDSASLTYAVVDDVSNGSLLLAPDGSFTYTPDADFAGTDSFTFTANDGTTTTPAATVTISVTAVNDAPSAGDDAYSTDEDTALAVAAPGVLGNDGDVDGSSLTAVLDTDVSHGTLVLAADGSISYTPAADFVGTDAFTYHATDGSLSSNVATVTFTVGGTNDAPTATAQTVTTGEDTATAITLVGSDPDGDSLTFTVVSQPANGTLSGSAPTLTYTPDPNYHGPDSFTFTVSDGDLTSAPATVSITVTPVNDAPTCLDGDRSTAEDTLLTGTVSCLDVDLDDLTVSLVSDVAHGTLTLDPDGSFRYTPDPNYHGPDGFTFTAEDGSGASDIATVSITVTPVNDGPILAPIGEQSVAEGATLTVPLAASDVDQDELTFSLDAGAPAWVTLTDEGDGTASLTLSPGFADGGTYPITITVSDGSLDDAETFDIVVGGTNRAPTADDQSVTTAEDTATAITLAATDPDNDPLTYTVVSQPEHGVLSGTAPDLTYTPAANYHGPDGFTFTAEDGSGASDIATVSITVTPVADAPTFDQDLGDQTSAEGDVISLDAGATDADGDVLTYAATGLPAGLSINATSGLISGTVGFAAAAASPYSVTVTVRDGETVDASDTFDWIVDDVSGPSVTITSSASDPTRASTIPVSVTFSETVTGFTESDLVIANATVSGFSGSGTSYSLTLTPIGDGIVTAAIPADAAVAAAGVGNQPSNELTRTVDRAAPTVTLTSPAPGSVIGDPTPTMSGVGGTATGDSATVTVRIHAGSTTGGALLQTLTAPRDADSGAYAVDASALPLGTYTAVASQADAAGNQGASTSTTFTVVDATPPGAPTGLLVTPRSTGLFVDWANSDTPDIAGYDIYRSATSGGPLTKLNTALLTSSQYLDAQAPTGVTSYYEVRAVDTAGNVSDGTTSSGTRPAIAFRSASTASKADTSSLVIPRPTGVAAGDVLIAALSMAGDPSITVPSGWSLVQNQVTGSGLRQVVYVRVAGGSENPSYTWAFSSAVTATGIIDAYSGVDPAQPIDAAAGRVNASSSSIVAPSVTTSTGVLLVGFFGTLTNAAITPAPGMVEQAEIMISGKKKVSLESADQVLEASGPTGTRTATADKAAVNVGQSIVLRPIGAATPPDGEAPTPPSQVAASVISSTQVDLTWRASSDNVGVDHYVIFRSDGAGQIGTSTVARFSDTTAAPDTTYTYTVRAVDAAGNTSDAATSNSVTTPATPPPPAPEVTFRAATYAANKTGTTLQIARPAGTTSGDVLLASIDVLGAVTVTPPTGWQQVRIDVNGTALTKATYVHVAGPGEPGSYTWTFSTTVTAAGGIHAYRGVDTTTPIDVHGGSVNASSVNLTSPSVDISANGSMLVAFFGISTNASIAPPSGTTERGEVIGSGGAKIASEGADETSPAGPSGIHVAKASKAGPSIGHVVVLKPAP